MKRLLGLVVLLALALAQVAGWQAVPAPGGICSDGSPWRFYVSPGDPQKVVLDFQGGGACWDAATCRPGSPFYRQRVDLRELQLGQGIYDRKNPDNPFAGWTHIFIPYCTGDLHVGQTTVDYGGFKVHHQGARNVTQALAYLFRNHPRLEALLITGCSAGGYGAVFWAHQLLEVYPKAKVAVCGDAAVGVATQDFAGAARWQARLPSLPGLAPNPRVEEIYRALAQAYPKARFAQFTTALDTTQVFFYGLMKGETSPGPATAQEWAREAQASLGRLSALPNFRAYLAPGDFHCILPRPEFYTLTVDGVAFRDWLKGLLE